MLVYLKRIFKASAIAKFSYNKLHLITGLHANTCRKYIHVLMQLGLAEFVGKDNRTLVLRRISSRHQSKNIYIGNVIGDTIKNIELSLLSLFNVEIVRHKLYAKQVIANANGECNDVNKIRQAKRKARDCSYGREFVDNGLSLKSIAKRLKCGLQKAQNIIKFAIKHSYLNKQRNFKSFYDPMAQLVYALFPNKYTFATKNNLYIIEANTYTLGERVIG